MVNYSENDWSILGSLLENNIHVSIDALKIFEHTIFFF